ncbi:MAG: CPBP family intramembrane metalloprotease [Bacteroidia bacterium]|nr:CPBP family intramembrane metalloprotease [Bacteroidia bacterium]
MDYEFHNRFIARASQSGRNNFSLFILGLFIIVLFYLIGGLIATMPLISSLHKNGFTNEIIQKNKQILFDSEATDLSVNFIMFLQFLIFIITLPGIFLAILLHKRKFMSFISHSAKFRWNFFCNSIMIWGIFNILIFLNSLFFENENLIPNFKTPDFFYMLPVLFVCVPIQTFVEEFLFRSYLIQGITFLTKNSIPAIIISALLFSISHASNPEIKAFGFEVMLLFYFIFGLGLGFITVITEGLEMAWGIHLIHNLLSGILITSENSVLKTNALFVTVAQNAWSELIFVTAGLSFFSLIIINKFKLSISYYVFK